MKDYNLISKIYDLTHDQLMGLAVQVKEHPAAVTDLAAQRDALEAVLGIRYAERKAVYDYYYSGKEWPAIRSADDYEYAALILKFIKSGDIRDDKSMVISLKCAMRRWASAPVSENRVIHDDGMGGAITLVQIPGATSREDAEAYFKNNLERHYRPSAYDCTGQIFTLWHKPVFRSGSWWCYHCFGVDC